MVDRIDIFDDGTDVAEPEVPTFLGVEQEKLGRQDYTSNFVNFFSQYYGMDSLGSGLGDIGIGIDEPEDITELSTPEVREPTGDDKSMGTFESSFPGVDIGEVSYDYSGGSNPFDSYSDYLGSTAEYKDRVPGMEFFTEPLVTGNFEGIDLSKAFFGEYEATKTDIKEAPGTLGEILKGNITEDQKRKLASGLFAGIGGGSLFGATIGSITGGDVVKNAFGNNSMRPNGLLGLAADITHAVQYSDMAQIRAAHAANAALGKKSFDSGALPDELTTGASSFTPTGFAMEFSTGFGVTRRPGSIYYNGNTMGMSRSQLEAMEAVQRGYVPKSFDVKTETGTTFAAAGWLATGNTGKDGAPGEGQGFYTDTGSFYSPSTNSYSAYGRKESAIAAAVKAGISLDEFNRALADARNGKGKLSDNVNKIRQDNLNKAEAARKAEEARKEAEAQAKRDAEIRSQRFDHYGSGGGSGPDDVHGFGTASDEIGGLSHARGGKVGYALGTPSGGAQQPSGFIDAPPSQVADGQKVADNRDMEVKEGTYVLNAAAVEFAGEQDIRKMIMDAQKEAIRRGLSTEDFERHSDLIDIAVSSGEVTIAPHLVKIIGEDRLEKINNRGLRKTEERIQRAEADRPQADRPVPVSRGGFLYHAGGEVHSHAKAAQSSESSERDNFYEEMDELRKRQDEQARRQSQTPSLNTGGEKLRYRQGIEFGDIEVYADILGKTNYNSLIQAAARDTRTLSDYVTTLKKDEEVASFIGNPLGQYSRSAYSEDILNVGPYESGITMKNPSFFLNPDTSNTKGYTAVLAHELMHKGADTLANDPNFKPSEALVKMQQKYSEIPSITDEGGSKAAGQRVSQGDAEHRYIAAVIGQAYLKRDMESLTGTMQKLKKEGIKITDYEAKFTTKKDGTVDYDLVAFYRAVDKKDISLERKFAVRNEIRRVYSLYLTDENRNQFIDENKTMFEEDYGLPMNLDSIEDIPYSALLKSYASINRIMAEDYMTQLFEGAVANKPVDIPRMEKQPTPEIDLPPEQKYERGFLDKMLGVTPAY